MATLAASAFCQPVFGLNPQDFFPRVWEVNYFQYFYFICLLHKTKHYLKKFAPLAARSIFVSPILPID
jgi:hypothetical protein